MDASWHHDTAIVDDGAGARPAPGLALLHMSPARIGASCSFGQNVFVGNDVVDRRRVKIQNNVSVYDAVTLDDVFCGPSVVFTNVSQPARGGAAQGEYRAPSLKRAARWRQLHRRLRHHGGRARLRRRRQRVNRDVPAFALDGGRAGRRIGWMSRNGERLAAGAARARRRVRATGSGIGSSATAMVE